MRILEPCLVQCVLHFCGLGVTSWSHFCFFFTSLYCSSCAILHLCFNPLYCSSCIKVAVGLSSQFFFLFFSFLVVLAFYAIHILCCRFFCSLCKGVSGSPGQNKNLFLKSKSNMVSIFASELVRVWQHWGH